MIRPRLRKCPANREIGPDGAPGRSSPVEWGTFFQRSDSVSADLRRAWVWFAEQEPIKPQGKTWHKPCMEAELVAGHPLWAKAPICCDNRKSHPTLS